MVTRKSVTILFKMINTPYTRSNNDNWWGSQANNSMRGGSSTRRLTMICNTKGSTMMTSPTPGRSSNKGAAMMNDDIQKALGLFSNLQRHLGLNNQQQRSVQELHNRAATML
jgi:hypothetical protein